nr:hypothetical protein GCM10020093_096230 [Planobispora longispora]
MTAIAQQASRRRTFAVISHPDAGKSTMTEALALHASAITEAGAVHGKAGRRGVTSDWMDMEKARGISITSAALRFEYRDHVFNLVDTPGHADFSEDTYRVLAAVDCAVMLLDAAKGMEPQTLKLFEVCRHRRIPVITFINKWDRPGREALELLDEIEERTGLRPTPITWPIGTGGFFHGVIDRIGGQAVRYTRTPGGATKAIETELTPERALAEIGEDWERAREEADLLTEIGSDHDQKAFEAHESTPVLFGAALSNFGVGRLLDAMVDIAPAPAPRPDVNDDPRPLEEPFAGLVFKVQANMDPSHRDRIAFVRVCSGRFERGMVLTHAATGRPFATKYAQSVFGQERATIDEAFPGDVIGLVNATALRPGDTLYEGPAVEFPKIPSFAPEHFWTARVRDSSRSKQFRKGIEQMEGRASSRCSAPRSGATSRRCSRRSAPCSSTWSSTGWPGSSTPRSPWTGSTSASPGSPTPSPRRSWPASAAWRSSPGPSTGRCWRCSPTSGGCAGCCVTTRTWCWNRCSPTPAADPRAACAVSGCPPHRLRPAFGRSPYRLRPAFGRPPYRSRGLPLGERYGERYGEQPWERSHEAV